MVEQGGRRMSGLIFLNEEHCNDEELKDWVRFALKFVKTLPAE